MISGPGGAGKGTVASRLVDRDPSLKLSRSWTTRARREGEPEGAYRFVDRETFERRREEGGFLEWTEFLGNLYGTPVLAEPSSEEPGASGRGRRARADGGLSEDVVLEIDLQGALHVKARHPDAVVVLLLPPSEEVQAERLRARGDDEEEVSRRIALGREEERLGRGLTPHVVVNDDVDKAVSQLAAIIAERRTGD